MAPLARVDRQTRSTKARAAIFQRVLVIGESLLPPALAYMGHNRCSPRGPWTKKRMAPFQMFIIKPSVPAYYENPTSLLINSTHSSSSLSQPIFQAYHHNPRLRVYHQDPPSLYIITIQPPY